MQPRRLLILRAVAQTGSLGKAAAQLGWTQPAVGQHMRALEREVGHPLILRGHSGVTLTEPGRVLLARANELATILNLAAAEQADFRDLRRGTVRVAAFGSAGATLIPSVVATLHVEHPAIDVRLTEAEPDESISLLAGNEVDIAVVFRYPPEVDRLPPGVIVRELRAEPVSLVVPVASALSDDVTATQLADQRWIAGCPRCRRHLEDLCRVAGFVPRVQHSTDDYVIAQNLVAAGVGIALLPAAALTAFRHPGVRTVTSPSWGVRHVAVAFHKAAERLPTIAAALEALQRCAQR